MSKLKIELNHEAIQAWLKSDEMAQMLKGFAAQTFDEYEPKIMGTRVIVVSNGNHQKLLKKAKSGGGS